MADVFISYAHEDQAYTRKLRDSLRQRGFEVWMDEHLESGDRWLRTIEQAVRDSAVLVVVMTPESRDSEWVEREILLAESESKPIFPLLLRGTVFFLLVTKQYTDVTNGRLPPDDFYERLEREVRPRSKEEIVAPVAPEPAGVRKEGVWSWQRLRLPLAVVGLLTIVLLVGAVASGIAGGSGEPIPMPPAPVIVATPSSSHTATSLPIATLTPTPIPRSPTSTPALTPAVREKDGMEMVYVPGGTFQMGSTDGDDDEQPVHTATLDSFWIDRTQVTNAQYARCVADGTCSPPSQSGSWTRDSYYGDGEFDDYPVIHVSWYDADTYCQWVGGRLPTEAEWEYAARGPDGQIYPWGNDLPNDTLLNYNWNVGDTTAVGADPDGASWVGAMGLAGNVLEWVADWYDSEYYASSAALNPTGPETGENKVLRGGSWSDNVRDVRAASRSLDNPVYRNTNIGFRCVTGPGVGSTKEREKDDMVMVYVLGGTFEMGRADENEDEQPVHTVTLDSFWIDQTEVTNSQYARCVGERMCSAPSPSDSRTRDSYYGDSQFDDYPVINVSWHDADTFCQWAGGRLPTEAEWEYAARGPDGHVYPWGDDPPHDTLLNYDYNVGDTTRVGSYPGGASWVGAMDMAGNVWEWVSDWYADDYYTVSPAANPTGPDAGDGKVLRGGSWLGSPDDIRSASRGGDYPVRRDIFIGFRCVTISTPSP